MEQKNWVIRHGKHFQVSDIFISMKLNYVDNKRRDIFMVKLKDFSIILVVGLISIVTIESFGVDWTQLQGNAQKTGRTTDQVLPPYRPRWVWMDTTVVRNKLSNSSWSGPNIPPDSILGNLATLPTSVPFTFAGTMQPVIADGKVFVGDMDGKVYGVNADDGSTLWKSDNPGGTIASPAYANGVIAFASLGRAIRGYNATTGSVVWTIPTKGPAVAPPATDGTNIYAADLGGYVYCINASNGNIVWKSTCTLGAQIVGGLALDSSSVYVCCENMYVYALNISDGRIRASRKVAGQSFYRVWPVVYSNLLFVQAAPVAIIGSEYVGEDLMSGATSVDDEQNKWIQFYQGNTSVSSDASPDYKHLTVLRTSDLTEPFVVPDGPYDGCGTPPDPPVLVNISGTDRILAYFKSKWNTFARNCGFGTNYQVDMSAIDLTTGRRIQINLGKKADNEWYTWESDNLYGLTCGGNMLFLRQNFRGTVGINLTNANATMISTVYKTRDGGTWYPDMCYEDEYPPRAGDREVPQSTNPEVGGRVGPAISGTCIYFTEDFCLTCMEHHQ